MCRKKVSWVSGLLAVCFATVLSGCGKDMNPDYRPVTGTVLLDGKPLFNARIAFTPAGGGSSGNGWTDENGIYRLYYAAQRPGAKIGENEVEISCDKNLDDQSEGRAGRLRDEDYELLPARYNRKTTLTANVEKKKENVIDFSLESK